MIADIDNLPVVINISDQAIDAYEKKAIPLNTLANAVLRNMTKTGRQLQTAMTGIWLPLKYKSRSEVMD